MGVWWARGGTWRSSSVFVRTGTSPEGAGGREPPEDIERAGGRRVGFLADRDAGVGEVVGFQLVAPGSPSRVLEVVVQTEAVRPDRGLAAVGPSADGRGIDGVHVAFLERARCGVAAGSTMALMLAEDGLQRFRDEVESKLPDLVAELLACPAHRRGLDRAPKLPGIYLYSEGGRPMYVGRTRNLAARWGQHTQPSSGIDSAAFAFNIARRQVQAAVGSQVSRKGLAADPAFAAAFLEAKARVRGMDYRYVIVESPVLSTVGEVYAAIALGTEGDYNAFETH